VKKSFNIQQLLQHKSKRHGTKPMHPSSSRALQREQEHNLKHAYPVSADLIATKQNKLPSFINRSARILLSVVVGAHLIVHNLFLYEEWAFFKNVVLTLSFFPLIPTRWVSHEKIKINFFEQVFMLIEPSTMGFTRL